MCAESQASVQEKLSFYPMTSECRVKSACKQDDWCFSFHCSLLAQLNSTQLHSLCGAAGHCVSRADGVTPLSSATPHKTRERWPCRGLTSCDDKSIIPQLRGTKQAAAKQSTGASPGPVWQSAGFLCHLLLSPHLGSVGSSTEVITKRKKRKGEEAGVSCYPQLLSLHCSVNGFKRPGCSEL